MRERYIVDKKTGKLIPRNEAALEKAGFPSIIRDAMAPMQSMVDGRVYDSKSEYLRSIREANARDGGDREIVGNDYRHLMREAPMQSGRDLDRAIARSLERLS